MFGHQIGAPQREIAVSEPAATEHAAPEGVQALIRSSVYQQLREDVLSCVLRPGALLQERDLAQRFAVSKSPVRDALLKLEAQGLIEVLPRRGYRVRQIDVRDVRDMYGLRLMLERECVQLLIERADAPALAALDAFRVPPEARDLPGWIGYNRAFHSAIAQGCGNARLARIACDMIEQFDRLTYVSVTEGDAPAMEAPALDAYVAEHGVIIDAIQHRNRRRAAALVREHIESSRRRVMAALQRASVIDTTPTGVNGQGE